MKAWSEHISIKQFLTMISNPAADFDFKAARIGCKIKTQFVSKYVGKNAPDFGDQKLIVHRVGFEQF